MTNLPIPVSGCCDCGEIRFQLTQAPLFVHCCHCRWCQRETGSAFALNAMIEAEAVELLAGTPVAVRTPSNSGLGQIISRCPTCHVALWSVYAGMGPLIQFVRVGTLEQADLLPPDIHIFTSSKQPWVPLPADTPAVTEYYDRKQHWPQSSLDRFALLKDQLKAYRAQLDMPTS